MQLLDLPLELFGEIIQALILSTSLQDATRARFTCRTFASAIDEATVSNATIQRIFIEKPGRYPQKFNFFKFHAESLVLKTKPKEIESNIILKYLEGTVQFLSSFDRLVSETQQRKYKEELCVAMAMTIPIRLLMGYLLGSTLPELQSGPDMSTSDTVGMLAAAAAVGHESALRYMMTKTRNVTTRSQLFGAPLLAACVNEKLDMVNLLLITMETSMKPLESRLPNHVWLVIKALMDQNRAAMVPHLLSWWFGQLPSQSIHVGWARSKIYVWAIRTGHVEVLKVCDQYVRNLDNRCASNQMELILACRHGRTNVVEYLMQNNELANCPHGHGVAHLTEGLRYAAKENWFTTVTLLLDRGADVNGTHDINGKILRGRALYWAVKAGSVETVALLLAHGALVHVADDLSDTNVEMAARAQGGVVEELVSQALAQQAGE